MIDSWAKSVSSSGVSLTEAKESISTQFIESLLLKNGFYDKSVIFIVGLYVDYFPLCKPYLYSGQKC